MAYEENTVKEHHREWLGMEGGQPRRGGPLGAVTELRNEACQGENHTHIWRRALSVEATASANVLR